MNVFLARNPFIECVLANQKWGTGTYQRAQTVSKKHGSLPKSPPLWVNISIHKKKCESCWLKIHGVALGSES